MGRLFVIRVDSSILSGSGHVVRCLTLAEALRLRGGEVEFVCREHPGNLIHLIRNKGFAVHTLPAPALQPGPKDSEIDYSRWLGASQEQDSAEVITVLEGRIPEWMVVDHYGIAQTWHERLRSHVEKLMVIDDLANRSHDCDLLLDQNLVANSDERYIGKIPSDCKALLGTMFALLQPAYADFRARCYPRTGPIRRILVYFGGSDIRNLTGMAIEAFHSLERKDLELDVVLPAETSRVEEIRSRLSGSSGIRFHAELPTLAHLMADADLAIGAAGSTSWERCCLGLPALVVSLAENQMKIVRSLHEAKVVDWIGDISDMTPGCIEKAMRKALTLPTDLLRDWSLLCSEVCDGRGAERVVDNMFGGVSPA